MKFSQTVSPSSYEPHADNGFFGPDSVMRKVWSYPTGFIIGFARATSIEYLDPNLAAAAMQSGGVRNRPRNRYDRTVSYFALGSFGAAEPAVKAADVLVRIHSKAVGHDPVTGGTYDANDPGSQLWIHMTAWHSLLKAYEVYGPGKLSEDEELQYWAECAVAAALTTVDPADVPRSREEVHAYFEAWRPRMAISEDAMVESQMIAGVVAGMPEKIHPLVRPAIWLTARMFSEAIIHTYPRHIQHMLGMRPNRVLAPFVKPYARFVNWMLNASPALKLLILNFVSPATTKTVAPMILGIPPESDKVWDVREAQAEFGFAVPADAHPDFRAKQRDRIFARGEKTSDEALIESQAHWGKLQNYNYA